MSEKLKIIFFSENEFSMEPFQVSKDTAGYDLFDSEARTILPKTCASIPLCFRMAIPKGLFYSKIFPRFGLLKRHLITCDGGVIDADFRGSAEFLMINHHPHDVYTVRTGDRIAQVVFMKKFDAVFENVSDPALLERTKRGSGGFGSTGLNDSKIFVIDESVSITVNDKVIIDSVDNNIIIDSGLSGSDNFEEVD